MPRTRPSLRDAAALLSAASDHHTLLDLATLCDFEPHPARLDDDSRLTLGVPPDVHDAFVVRGRGTRRAIVVVLAPDTPIRDAIARLATRLAARTPHVHWLLFACQHHSTHLAIAAWDASRRPPRVTALVADRDRILPTDAETLLALTTAPADSDALTHSRWLDILGRDALTRRFYRTLERLVGEMADRAVGLARGTARREIALLYVSRLLFLAFLEAKGWLDGNRAFLAHRFDACMINGGCFQRRVLVPLFFGTLNTPVARRAPTARAFGRIPFLNGGLFARTAIERQYAALAFPDEQLGALFGELLGRYRFTAREDSSTWSEAAIDPEMLGKAFESLMAARERRGSGAFYTPHALVMRVTNAALTSSLVELGLDTHVADALLAGHHHPTDTHRTVSDHLARLRILDPACGSGAFLVHTLERIAALRATLGDPRPISDIRREVLASSIFGVDVNPTAVWLCELRLWLSVLIESDETDPLRVPPLPNLDRHVRAGDSLAGGDFRDAASGRRSPRALVTLRHRYARSVGARKHTLARALEREERAHALATLDHTLARLGDERKDVLLALRSRDLFGARRSAMPIERDRIRTLRRRARETRTLRHGIAAGSIAVPFGYAWHFPDIGARGGFDIVIGNPPWVRVHRIPSAERARWRQRFAVYRDATWRDGARGARAATGFGSQIDLAALFVERALDLVRPAGTVALLVPGKLWRSLAGGGLRRELARHTLAILEDWSDARALFDAAVYPSLLVVRRRTDSPRAGEITARVIVHRRSGACDWLTEAPALPLDDSAGSPWVLAPPHVRAAFDALTRAGVRLGDRFGPPTLGVKCGVNEAFLVDEVGGDASSAVVRAGAREGRIERALLRPLLRGEMVGTTAGAGTERLLYTHDRFGTPLDRLPPLAAHWLAPWRSRLESRSDLHGRARWWSLFRLDGAPPDRARVVWPDVTALGRAQVLEPGDPTVPLNSCYVLPCADAEDARTIAAIISSPIAWAWLALLAEPARGAYRRLLGWTMALFPLPLDWPRARALLAPAHGAGIGPASGTGVVGRVLRAYRLAHDDVIPLLDWSSR